jgi:hypothetical protein
VCKAENIEGNTWPIPGENLCFVQEKIQKTQENQGFLPVFGRKGLAFSAEVCYSNTR